MKNILFSGGGTLGHIYPLVSVARKLLQNGYNLFFIGTIKGLEKEFLDKEGIFKNAFYFDSEGFKRSFSLKNIRVIYKHLKNIKKARKIIRDEKIDLVIGMGGYISAAVIMAGIKEGKRTIIHEQNAVLGLANKLVYKKVDKVLLTYPINDIKNSIIVGNPRITEIFNQYKNNQNYCKGNYVLVVGGSRGASRINELVINLNEQFLNSNIECILITGKKYYLENKELIDSVNCEKFKVIDFSYDLPSLLIEAKVVVSRCGASTLAELMALKKVSLLIPSPNVTSNHQEKNAMEIVDNRCAMMLKEEELSKEKFFDCIHKLFYDKRLRSLIVNNIGFNIKTDALDKFYNEVISLLKIE